MWLEILLALGPSVLEAIGTKLLDIKTKAKVKKELDKIVKEQFKCFVGTSLDCESFYEFIESTHFIEIVRNYFFIIKDGLDLEEYRLNIEYMICSECNSAQINDVKKFLNKIEELYMDFLRKIIEDYPGLNASFQLMSISHREIISKIQDSQNELKRYLSTLDNRKIPISDENIKQYHSVTEKEFSEIRFTGIAGAERRRAQSINEFYVENTFSYFGKEIDKLYKDSFEKIESIKLENFFDFGNKIILIGGAGLGKSTTLNYLYCNYEKLYDSVALKLKIDLKEYAEEIGEKKKGILWCIANEFIKRIRYSGQTIEQIQGIVADKLNTGSCLIILDALDEIPTQTIRNTVRTEIETFTSIYYLNRFIISTREAGYLKNRFDDTFLHIRINKFNFEQIKKYSRNWYLSYYEEKNDFDEFWSKFYAESKRARCHNLISNPIILVLALVIFDFENSLPTRRIEFYQKCIDTFLTERENRKAVVKLSDKTKSILAMNLSVPKIAFYKHNKISENVGYKFNYQELKESIFNAIDVVDKLNWMTAVDQFAEYLVERTELIQEIDDDTLDFAHKTFYEYFLAFYFSKMYENDEIVKLLYNWIGDSNFDELARLIIEVVIQNNDPKQHDRIINCLFDMLSAEELEKNKLPSKQDVFAVVSDLYTHNLLQPKFQYKYNEFVLFNPRFIDYMNFRFRREEVKNNLVLYDANIICKMFINNFQNNNLTEVLDALYYLNNDFKRQVISSDDSGLFFHINRLFSLLKENKKKTDLYLDELEYFLNEGIKYSLSYPQIFTSIIALSVKSNAEIEMERLLEYEFNSRNVFYKYTTPEILYGLISKAMKSKKYFVLFLSAIVDCAFKVSNSIFEYVFRHMDTRYLNEKDCVDISKFCIELFNALNKSESYDAFKMWLFKMNLYEEGYNHIYEKTFTHYIEREKGLHDEKIIEFIKRT